jgi:hypothetical protein
MRVIQVSGAPPAERRRAIGRFAFRNGSRLDLTVK